MPDLKPRLFAAHRLKLPPSDNYAHSVVHFLSFYCLFITITLLVRLLSQTLITPIEVQALRNPVSATPKPISPGMTLAVVTQPSPTPLPSEPNTEPQTDPLAEREEIRAYISTIFGSAASTAYAISLAEGKAPNRYKGEVVYNTAAVRKTASEYSVGIFQINLKSDYAKVHYDRIPGSSLDEKVAWLQNPYNNTLFAYWVYSTHSNFEPWTSYTGGKYLAYLP